MIRSRRIALVWLIVGVLMLISSMTSSRFQLPGFAAAAAAFAISIIAARRSR
jgi:membrane protein implicated in regulation of membrane protease activity